MRGSFKPGRGPTSELQQQINKRLTLNLLIQGAAAHTYTSANHLVRDQLEELQPGLTRLYDQFAIAGQLNYCIGDNALIFGRPNRFWGYSRTPQKPFRNHPLMSQYGNWLASQSTEHLKKLAQQKDLKTSKWFHWLEFVRVSSEVLSSQVGIELQLEEIGAKAVSEMWGISTEKLDGKITNNIEFGNLAKPKSFLGRKSRSTVIGYGGVERRNDRFTVVARAWVFPILVHELVKGTVELICLRGLNELDDEMYAAVVDEADQLEYEVWLLQAGPEMWRRFIATAPREQSLAHTVMKISQLEPLALDKLMIQIIEEPNRATDVMRAM